MPSLPVALLPGHPNAQSVDDLKRNLAGITLPQILENLMRPPAPQQGTAQKELTQDVAFSGDLDAVNEFFYTHQWSDGLPIVPPTRSRIEQFLRFTDRSANDVLGTVLPDNCLATIWSIAVNGVMAGCRPEYMPILVALVEAMIDPRYGVEHSGNTPAGETLIILNGPIARRLGFNYTHGVLRDGFRPNTSIGRFWRLYLRNVAGFLPTTSDRATFGNTWRVVLAENEEVLERIGWPPNSVEMGYANGSDTVTIARYTGGDVSASVCGSTPEEMLPYLAASVLRQTGWQITFTVGLAMGTLRPLLLLTPIMAETMAKAGWSKSDVKRYLFEQARIPAWQFERQLRDWTRKQVWNLTEEANAGRIPGVFHESDDPQRLVPIVWRAEDFMIAVTGDLLRNDAYVFAHNGMLGYPVAKEIRLPLNWEHMLASPAK